ncbi:ATP-dependent DNA helicase RecG [Nesterenkonia alba]|uniref:ATP-dependent DNA helicase RecG n=1 Tax=Nesterenkonia alba TaxID=515814 RepID=UPI0003B5AEDE|nr:ATP-dependent DNA helicase RecG [Nesterenkonia alba]
MTTALKDQTIGPETPLTRVLDSKDAKKLTRELGYTTVGELLGRHPRKYADLYEPSSLDALIPGEYATFTAEVEHVHRRSMQRRKGFLVEVTVADVVGRTLTMAFFMGYQAEKALRAGTLAWFHGQVTTYRDQLTLNNPDFAVIRQADGTPGEGEDLLWLEQLDTDAPIPIYPARKSLPSWTLLRCVRRVLAAADEEHWPDPVPAEVRAAEDLPSELEAHRLIHTPGHLRDPERGLRRLRFTEAFLLQGVREDQARELSLAVASPAPPVEDGLLAAFDEQLEFELTEGQRHCGELIAGDLAAAAPMNRLLQGEVGSGKTLVALRAMLQVVDAGGQAAFIAPTEVLALQHARSIHAAVGELPVGITVLTGSMSTSERKKALLDIASGAAGIVIGTHAVLSEKVSFAALGLVVIDEQHRFGVEQRNALRERYTPTPHMLVMSATPIPRSVAVTVFGDLELTVLDGLPAGRSPIATHVVPMIRGPEWINRVWARVAETVAAGHQVYIVCPKISQTEQDAETLNRQLLTRFGLEQGAAAVELTYTDAAGIQRTRHFTRQAALAHIAQDASVEGMEERLRAMPQLAGVRLEVAHGQMPAAETAERMRAFERGEIDVLLATTVVEVGVDVPNATMMVILDADSFGISTLHQLRGRIGRGRTEGNLCLLVTRLPEDHPSMERLHEVASTGDGMALARLDLRRRREGDVLGATQTGRSQRLKLLRLVDDEDLIRSAEKHITALTTRDPTWETAKELRRRVTQWRADSEVRTS